MLQQSAVQAPITFRKGWRRKRTEKYKGIPTERKITETHLRRFTTKSLAEWTVVDTDGERGWEWRGGPS